MRTKTAAIAQPLATVALTLATLASGAVACSSEPTGQVQARGYDRGSTSRVRTGLYAFDGTRTDAQKGTIIRQMYERAALRTKGYFAGPELSGSDTRRIVEAGKARICNDWRLGKIDGVSLTGYSRGAIVAAVIAHDLLVDSGPGRPRGCANVSSSLAGASVVGFLSYVSIHKFIGRGDVPQFNTLALLDAVNTFNRDMGGNRTADIKRLSPWTQCTHIVKHERREVVAGVADLSTTRMEGCDENIAEPGVRHEAIAKHAPSRDSLERALSRFDLTFGEYHSVDRLPPADYRFLCPRVRPITGDQNADYDARIGSTQPGLVDTGYRACFHAGCTWSSIYVRGGTCEAPNALRLQIPPVPAGYKAQD
jgi:hypothetical protein